MRVLGEYLGQVEILRRRIQFLDLGKRRHRAVVERFTAIATVLNEDGESRLGYAELCWRLEGEPEFAAWRQPPAGELRRTGPQHHCVVGTGDRSALVHVPATKSRGAIPPGA